MKLFTIGRISLTCLLAGFLHNAQAQLSADPAPETHCLLLPLDPATRVQRAALIVEGEVLSSRGFWDAGHQRIYTAHQVRVFKGFKGSATPEITVLTEGGSVDLDRQVSTNTLHLAPGQQGILFLYPAPFAQRAGRAGWAAYASEQGFVEYDLATLSAADPFRHYASIEAGLYQETAALTGQPVRELQPNAALTARARQPQPGPARPLAPLISTLSPLSLTAGTGAVLTINGTGFGASRGNGFVEFRNAADGGATFVRPQVADYVSWADNQIQVRVPSNGISGRPAGTGTIRVTTSDQVQALSTVALSVVYALSTVQDDQTMRISRPRHSNQNGTGGYTFRFNPDIAANAAARQAWQRALATWRCQTGINWEVGPDRPGSTIANDGDNAVAFDPNGELPEQVLGRTTSYYQGCRDAAGNAVFWVKEIDMQFSSRINWQFGPAPAVRPQYDFESVVVHELGHAQQLAHVIQPAAVMHYAIAAGANSRAISSRSDIAGGRLVLQGRSFVRPLCGPAPMLPAPLLSFVANATGGRTELTWTTRDECNVQAFELERATDTTAWQPIAALPTSITGTYRYQDPQPLPGLSYYRLRLRRPDGTRDDVAPQAVTDDASLAQGLQLYPNPVADEPLRLLYQGTAAGQLSLYFYDAVGRRQGSVGLAYQPGLNQLSLPVASLRPGWYVVRWRDQSGRTGTTRLVKL